MTGEAGAVDSTAGRSAEDDEFASIFAEPPEPSTIEEEHPQEIPSVPFEVKAVVQRTVLCVEAQDEIQDVLRKSLSRMGYRVLLVRDAELAAERFRESPIDVVIFDVDGQGAEGIDALVDMHDKAHEDERQLAAIVLLGPRQGALREKLPSDDRLIVLSKPLKMKDVQESIHRLVPPQ